MKKKFLVIIIAIIAAVACALGISACGNNSGNNGTYYLYRNEKLDKSQYINLDGSNWSDDDGTSGTFTLNGEKIVFYANVYGNNEEMFSGTLSDGALKIKVFGANMTYCKEDSIPKDTTDDKDDTDKPDNTPKTEYTVTFDANGGTFADGKTTATQKAKEGATLTAPASPTRTASAFSGWATEKNGKTLWKFATDTVTGNVTLYAVWDEPIATVLSVQGATIDKAKMSINMIVDSSTTSVALSNSVVCSNGSTWGLYYDKLGITSIATKIAVQPSGMLATGENIFYIIVFSNDETEINIYELSIYRKYAVPLNYFDNKGVIIKTETVYTKEKYIIDFDPIIKGYEFNFWKNSNGSKVIEIIPEGTVNIYADCTALSYTVSYNANGGEGAIPSFTIKSGQKFSSDIGAVFNREYFTLLNYNTEADGTGIEISLGSNINDYDFAQDITLYAIWQCHFKYINENNNLTIKGMSNKDYSNLTIPDKISNMPVTRIASEAFKDLTNLTSVTVPNTITEIGKGAFEGCSELQSIILPFAGKNNIERDNSHFGYIFGASEYEENSKYVPEVLKTATIESSSYIYQYTFAYCDSLTNITIHNGIIENCAIFACDNLRSITIGLGVKKLGYAFVQSNLALETIYWNATNCHSGGKVIFNCPNITNCILGDAVETIPDGLLEGCSLIKNIAIPNSVTSIGDSAFNSCSGLTSLTIPAGVTSIGSSAFYNCSKLTSITIPDGVTSIGYETFCGCSKLTSLTIPDSVTSIGVNAFKDCSSLTSIYYEGNIASWCGISGLENLNNKSIVYIDNQKLREMTSIIIPDSVTSIGNYAFSGCSWLTSITIPDSVTSIGNSAFWYCDGLKSVIIPDGVTNIGSSTFSGCSSLTSITIPDSVTSIGVNAFYDCSSLTSITIPDSVTSIGYNAFHGCSRLTIYCEAESKPSGWSSDWNYLAYLVVWGYKP